MIPGACSVESKRMVASWFRVVTPLLFKAPYQSPHNAFGAVLGKADDEERFYVVYGKAYEIGEIPAQPYLIANCLGNSIDPHHLATFAVNSVDPHTWLPSRGDNLFQDVQYPMSRGRNGLEGPFRQ